MKKMKHFAKVLVLTTLIAAGCLVGTRDVKAEATSVTLTLNSDHTLTWTFDADPTDPKEPPLVPNPVTNLTISASPAGGTAHSITDPSTTSGTLTKAEVLAIVGDGASTGATYTISAVATKDDGSTFNSTTPNPQALIYTPVTINISPSHGSIDVNSTPPKGFSDDTFTATWTAAGGYSIRRWNDLDDTTNPRSGMHYDTTYILYLTHDKEFTIDPAIPTTLAPNTGREFHVTVTPTDLYDYEDLSAAITDVVNCNPNFSFITDDTHHRMNVNFNPTGDGTFTLDLKHDGVSLTGYPKTITVGTAPTSIAIAGDNPMEVTMGSTPTLTITPTPSGASTQVTWESLTPSVATVDATGKVTPIAVGTATIQATSKLDTSKTATKTINVVRQDVTSITIGHGVTKGYSINLGYNQGLVTIEPSTASVSRIEWAVSSDSGEASLDSGKTVLTGTKKGKVKLTPTVYYLGDEAHPVVYDGASGRRDLRQDVEIYPPVTGDTSSSNSIKFTLPKAAYVDNTDDDNIVKVTGYRVDILNSDGESIFNESKKKVDSLEDISLSSDTIDRMVKSASNKFSGDTVKFRVKISPYDGDTSNRQYESSDKRVAYKSDEMTAYKVGNYYSLSKDGSNNNNNNNSNNANNANSKSGNAGAGLDKVPKTGEGNERLWFIIAAMAFATISGAILLSYIPTRGKVGAEEGVDDTDVFHTKE